jgi:hypothetical protein
MQICEQGEESEAIAASGCVFQDCDTRLCLVHANKPFEGRVAYCKLNDSMKDLDFAKKLRQDLINEWDSVEGRAVVGSWKETFFMDTPKSLSELQ